MIARNACAAPDVVLDANIPIRGVLGKKVRLLLTEYQAAVGFCVPATAFGEVKDYVQDIAKARGGDLDPAF